MIVIYRLQGGVFHCSAQKWTFTHFLEIFGQKKCPFGSKTVFLGQEVHYYMVYIAYFTELILQICDYAQKRRIWRENCKYALDKNFHCHFCSRRKAAKFCHPERHAKKLSKTSICNKTKSQPGTTICKKNCFKDNNLQFQNHYPEQQQHGRSFSGKIFFWGPLSR